MSFVAPLVKRAEGIAYPTREEQFPSRKMRTTGDPEKELEYLKDKADNGDVNSMYEVGLYLDSIGNSTQSKAYFKKAIAHGHVGAMVRFAMNRYGLTAKKYYRSMEILKRAAYFHDSTACLVYGREMFKNLVIKVKQRDQKDPKAQKVVWDET